MHRKCARTGWRDFLLYQRPGQRHDRHDHEEPAKQHVETKGRVVPGRISGETSKCAAIVPGARAESVENLTQPVRTTVVKSGQAPFAHYCPGSETKNRYSQD